MEFTTRRIEGVLLFFPAVVDQWAAVGMNRLAKKSLRSDLSQRWRVVQVANDFSTQYPEIVYVFGEWSSKKDWMRPDARLPSPQGTSSTTTPQFRQSTRCMR